MKKKDLTLASRTQQDFSSRYARPERKDSILSRENASIGREKAARKVKEQGFAVCNVLPERLVESERRNANEMVALPRENEVKVILWDSRYTFTLGSDELPVDSLSISTGSIGKTHNQDCRSRRDTH